MTTPDEVGMVMACRALDPEEYDGFRKKVWKTALADMSVTVPTYPGSIRKPCQVCGITVQVGPRQQQAIEQFGEENITIVCLVDVPLLVRADPNTEVSIHNLGNPYRSKEA